MKSPGAAMSLTLEEFRAELMQEVYASGDAEGRFAEDSFFELFCDHLVEAGEFEVAERAHYLSPKGIRVDGYGGDPLEAGGTLTLIALDFHQTTDVGSLTATEMNASFARVRRFLASSLESDFLAGLEESSPAFGMADLIRMRWSKVSRVRLLLASNRLLSTRVEGRDEEDMRGTPVSYSVWDIGRLHRYVVSARSREDLEVDLQNDFGGGISALPAHMDAAGYEAYLAVIPGAQLAAIYDRWGTRLLEQNVRCFLQARSKVNKGIRNTIQNQPQMFFAFNNGITATAEAVQKRETGSGVEILAIKNFQIVNGGQTTASIHAASIKSESDLARVFVQMKLSIIDHDRSEEVVPLISEYANSQNRVSAADFFSNHPFHIRMEEFSRRILAPSPDGNFLQTRWFYERARGQYQDARAYLTVAQRKKFDRENPKKQMFSKTDLAKFHNVWNGQPHIVSMGAQKNFANFAHAIGGEWKKNENAFNEVYYKESIAKAIIFRFAEQMVSSQSWYEGGYRANVVAYAIAKLAHDLDSRGLSPDFDPVWRTQAVPDGLGQLLLVAAESVQRVITNPAAGISNVTEWAKKTACWTRVQELKVQWPLDLREVSIGREEKQRRGKAAKIDQKLLTGIEAQMAVVNAGAQVWKDLLDWAALHKLLSEKERDILAVAAAVPGKIPSEKQSLAALEAVKKLHDEGCVITLNQSDA